MTQPSQSHGLAYAVELDVVTELRQDQQFLDSLRRAIMLVTAAWGWDLQSATPLGSPSPSQTWSHWPVRLEKAAVSARLFGLHDVAASLVTYAGWLEDRKMLKRYNVFFQRMRASLQEDGHL